MAGFLYFLPNRQSGLSPQEIKDAGLAYALDGPVCQQTITRDGPGGTAGVLLAAADHCDPARLRHVPGEQEWIETTFGWLGRWKEPLTGPADLIRPRSLPGHFVELADGQKWLCPVARGQMLQEGQIRWYHTLPLGVAMGPDRKWKMGEVVPKYRRLWDLALAWWDAKRAAVPDEIKVGDTIRFDFDGAFSAAAECLTANYRVGPDEISLLGLFDSDSDRKILDVLIDTPSLMVLMAELQKKTDSPAPGG